MRTGKANADIRIAAWSAGIPLWAVAEELGICEMTLSRWLRTELAGSKREQVLTAIQKLTETRN